MIAEAEIIKKVARKRKIPGYLVREVLDGKPLYYKGYKDVLRKKKTLEEILGSSTLQAFIIAFLMEVIIEGKLKKKYEVLVSEPGLHIDKKNNISAGLLIYDKHVLTPDKINTQYVSVSAKLQIEVDINIELEDLKDYQYVEKKINKIYTFGTERVIWILTNIRKVMVANQGQPWQVYDWQNDIELMDGVSFNIGKYLNEKGVALAPLH